MAETRDALKAALDTVRVDLEEIPGVFDPEAALIPEAPVVHEQSPDNVMAEVKIEKGDSAAAIDNCPVVVEGTFHPHRQEHAYLETESGWAVMGPDGRLTMEVSTQSPHRDRMELAEALGLRFEDIRISAPYLGGGFGGKDGMNVQPYLAMAAMRAGGRPVKMWWDRSESFLAGTKRLPGKLSYRLGADENGRLLALDCRIVLDGGAYEHLGGEVLALCAEHAGGPYRFAHVFIHGRCAYTNNPPGGPFRGFGVPQAAAGIEQMMDILAARLDMDPLELRRINAVRRGDEAPAGNALPFSTGARLCLDRLADHPLWRGREEWKRNAPAFKRRGAGAACIWHGLGYGPAVADYANSKVELTPEGHFRVDVGVVDMGQGNAAAFGRIAAEILNQDAASIELILPDTDRTLPSGSAAASRTTYTYGNALILAATKLKEQILAKASVSVLGGRIEDFLLLPGKIRHLPTRKDIPLSVPAGRMSPVERTGTAHWRAPSCTDTLKIETRHVVGLPHVVFSYAAHLALVEVDELTGRTGVVEYLAVTEGGRILNRQSFDQQIQGGIAQGLGFALFEDYEVRDGRTASPGLGAYVLPTATDVPDITSQAVEIHESTGPFGMKGVGELPVDGVLPAVANALADACGSRVERSPFTPERVLAALSGRKETGA